MRTLYLDCFSGISGDMFLGLLLDLGLDQALLEAELARLPITGYRLEVGREQRHGIAGTRLQVHCAESHHHRSWSDIDGMLAASAIDPAACEQARRIFRRLGEAEAKVHGVAIDDVHFHEVGAVDAIVDLTGAAIGLQLLGIEQLLCAPLPLSRGMGRSAHGPLPLPAPATLELLQGQPVVDSGCDKELVTPSGAAIVSTLASFGPLPEMRLERTGYGVGGWQLADRPNLLRGILGGTSHNGTGDSVCLLESHIDDSTGEQLGDLLEQLIAAGALDVGYSPLLMKKNRPGVRLTLVCRPEQATPLERLILRQSSAIGVRRSACQRTKLERRAAEIQTEYGPARVKLLYEAGRFLRLSAEFDDCRELARQSGRPLADIQRHVEQAAHDQLRPREDDPQ